MTKRKAIEGGKGSEPKLPRGHAYIHFRTDGYTFHIDFTEMHVEWIGDLIRDATKRMAEDEKDDKVIAGDGEDGG